MLYFKINHQILTLIKDDGVVNESQDYLLASFDFTDDWAGTIKVAQFIRGQKLFPEQPIKNNLCKVPWEVLVDAEPFKVTVIGHNEPGKSNVLITTTAVVITNRKNGLLNGIEPTKPTESVYGTKLAESLQAIDTKTDTALGKIDSNKRNSLLEIDGAKGKTIASINASAKTGESLVNSASGTAVENINNIKDGAISEIDTAKHTAVDNIENTKKQALQEVASSSEAAANSANNAKLSAGEAASSASDATASATEAGTQAISAASSANKAEQEAIRAANATDDKLDKKRFDNEQVAVPIIINALRQTGWAVEDIKARLKEYEDIEYGTITLNNTLAYPFNNSKETIALSRRRNKNYLVLTEIKAFNGNVGGIEVTERLTNGFKIAYTGSAPSATIEYVVLGGV